MDYFGDEKALSAAFDKVRSPGLREMIVTDPDTFIELQRNHGKRFATRLLSEIDGAKRRYGTTLEDGISVPRVKPHFPADLESLSCFAIDKRGGPTQRDWRYMFEVRHQPVAQKAISLGTKTPEFVTSFTSPELAQILHGYAQNDGHYKSVAESVARVINDTAVADTAHVIANASRRVGPG